MAHTAVQDLAVKKLINFGAGPSILPQEVLEEAARAVVDFNGMGLSLLEIGHRTREFEAVLEEAVALVKELMNLDNNHEVLFLQGGATTQFMMAPMNLLDGGAIASYTDTGTWAGKAIKEAKAFGHIHIASSSKDKNYTYIPDSIDVLPQSAYMHITTNETIAGTQWHTMPYDCGVPLVADMSSDILSRQLDFNRFSFIYAGAQKNLGPAGTTLTIIDKEVLGKVKRPIPSILDYSNHIKEKSMLNTPPMFAILVTMLNLRWLMKKGGIAGIEKINQAKAALMYNTIDSLPMFTCPNEVGSRSTMNAVFVMQDSKLEKEFLDFCKSENIYGIKGHRSVGGFRASMYNALPYESVEMLSQLMHSFAQKKG